MLPVTNKIPKPIVPVLNIPNLLHNVALLKRIGIREIILNTHHLGSEIQNFLGDGDRWGVHFSYSHEPLLLGTGGGLKKAESFFEGEPFVLCNCDFVTDVDLTPYLARHFERKAAATMILYEDKVRQAKYSRVGISAEGQLCSLRGQVNAPVKREGIFTGIHFLSSKVFEYLKEEPSGINEIFYPSMMREHPDQVFGDFAEHSYWYDTGDVEAFWYSSMKLLEDLNTRTSTLSQLLAGDDYVEQTRGVWIRKGFEIPSDTKIIGPVVIGRNGNFEKDCTLGPSVVIGDNVHLAPGTKIENSIVLADSIISTKKELSNAVYYKDAVLPFKK